jgi:hypothetical protein
MDSRFNSWRSAFTALPHYARFRQTFSRQLKNNHNLSFTDRASHFIFSVAENKHIPARLGARVESGIAPSVPH